MNAYTRTRAILFGLSLCLVALAEAAVPLSASGQTPEDKPLFLALPESFPALDARVVIVREPGQDVVLLRAEGADPETLDIALRVLRRVERDEPLPADRGQLIPITGFVHRTSLDAQRREALQSALDELAARPLSNVGNVGSGRWMAYRED